MQSEWASGTAISWHDSKPCSQGQAAHTCARVLQGSGNEEMLARDEVIRRLRLLGQPTTLFGEVGINGEEFPVSGSKHSSPDELHLA